MYVTIERLFNKNDEFIDLIDKNMKKIFLESDEI